MKEESANMSGQELYRRAKLMIPGGSQLLSKRPEMFLPEQWPAYYSKAKGVETWGLDGKKYIDMSYCGLGACVLGFADPDVDAAARKAIESGSAATLNCPEEVELAELLCELHPWAEMVRYARSGGEAMAIAVRIARARTGRDRVAFCGYHGWHDWYLSANLAKEDALDGQLAPRFGACGRTPRSGWGQHCLSVTTTARSWSTQSQLIGTSWQRLLWSRLEILILLRASLSEYEKLTTDIGAVLVFDEVSSGWRLTSGGAHLVYGVMPDIAVFAKAMSNGYPMAAIIGIEDAMRAAQKTFISSTHWTERIGPAAALATIRKYRACDVSTHLIDIGKRIQAGWREAADAAGLPIGVTGIPPLGHFSFDYEDGQAIRTLFTQRMLEKGFLATNSFYATHAHQDRHVRSYLAAVGGTFALIHRALQEDGVEELLKGPIAHSGFHRLT